MPGKPVSAQKQLLAENEDLRSRLDEALETLRAIRNSEVDALIVPGVGGEQVYTLKGVDHPYRELVEQMGEGALLLSLDGVILYANQRLAEMLKKPLEKVIGSSIQAWIAPDSQTILQSLLGKDNRNNRREQLDITASDGSRVPASLSVSNLFEDENPVSFCLVATDLTGQKHSDEIKASEKLTRELLAAATQSRRALLSVVEDQKSTQDALSASEAELRALFAAMTDAVIVYDADGRYIKVAPTNPVNLIKKPEELLGKSVHDVLPKEQADYIVTKINEAIQTNQIVTGEYFIQFGGEQRWFISNISQLSENTVVWVAHDITERKLKENQIQERVKELNTLYSMSKLIEREDITLAEIYEEFTNILPEGWQYPEITCTRIVVGGSEYRTKNFMESAWMQSSPIKVNNSTIGKIEVGYLEKRLDEDEGPFLKEERMVIDTVAERMGRLIQSKQAEEEIQNRNEELASLYQLSRILADADDLEHVIKLVNHHAAENLQTTFASIALLENDKLVMRGIYPVRELEHGELVVNPQPIASLPYVMGALEKNEPVILHAENARISSSERTFLQLDIIQSTCLVPLRVGSSLQGKNPALGLLVLGESRGNERAPFTPEKIQLARSIGDQAASAIRRMLVIEQASLRLQRITSLREIDTTISASFDIRLSLEVILKYVLEQLGVDAVAVLVVNSSQQRLEYKGGRGFRSQAIEHMGQRLDEGQAGLSLRERRMIYIQNVTASGASFAQSELMEAEQFFVYIAMPLIVKGKANGVLEIYNRSPLDPDEEWFDFLNTLAGQTALAIDTDQLFYGLQRSNIELGLAYDATIEGWSHALDLRDNETEGHSKRVTETTVKLAHSFNLSNENLKQIRWGALLHDIGKLGVPDGILLKPGPLTEEEWVVMKKHPTLAFEMLSPIQHLKASLDIPYCHHEKWDGTGYPRGLKGEQIPLAARIFAVVDVWDALISDRPYRQAWTKDKALNHIQEQSGAHFDPQVVKVFLKEISHV